MSNTNNEISFDEWYDQLKEMAVIFSENVSDADAWREDYDAGKTPEGSFYSEFPEHKG